MSEENQQSWDYIQPEDLIAQPTFKSSNKAGYVEETVDQWVKEARVKYTDLANDFNAVVYKLELAESSLDQATEQNANLTEANQRLMSSKGGPTQEEVDDLTAQLASAQEQYNELLENYEVLRTRNQELENSAEQAVAAPAPAAPAKVIQSYDRQASAEDGYTYVLEYTEEGNVATVKEFPELSFTGKNAEHALSGLMDAVDDRLVELQNQGQPFPQPGDYEVEEVQSGGSLDVAKVSAILDAASEEASEHVRRTQERMMRLEEAARREADSIVAEAHRDAEDSRVELAQNRSESSAIRNRMIMLLESQLNELHNNEQSVGYNPSLSPDASELREGQ